MTMFSITDNATAVSVLAKPEASKNKTKLSWTCIVCLESSVYACINSTFTPDSFMNCNVTLGVFKGELKLNILLLLFNYHKK